MCGTTMNLSLFGIHRLKPACHSTSSHNMRACQKADRSRQFTRSAAASNLLLLLVPPSLLFLGCWLQLVGWQARARPRRWRRGQLERLLLHSAALLCRTTPSAQPIRASKALQGSSTGHTCQQHNGSQVLGQFPGPSPILSLSLSLTLPLLLLLSYSPDREGCCPSVLTH